MCPHSCSAAACSSHDTENKTGHSFGTGKLAADGSLAAKLEGGGATDDGYHALLRLAWGLLLAQFGAESDAGQRRSTPCHARMPLEFQAFSSHSTLGSCRS